MFKEIKKIRKECPVCEFERDLSYREITEVLKVRGEDINVTSRVHYCPEGEHYFYDVADEEEKFQNAYKEYRRRKGLLQPDEIEKIRNQYGLSQKNFARLLGWGDITIHRYESGAIQDDAHNDVLVLIRSFDYYKQYFESKKNTLDPALAKKVEETINHRTIELLIRLFSAKREESSEPITSATMPTYSEQNNALKYSANEELALAA